MPRKPDYKREKQQREAAQRKRKEESQQRKAAARKPADEAVETTPPSDLPDNP